MYPPARKVPHRMEIHGDVRVDDYFWMRERDSQPVLDFLNAENRRTEEALRPIEGLRETLYREMRSRIKEDDSSVPVRDGAYHYYWRYQRGQEYPLHCRKRGSLDAAEEVYLDENQLAVGESYFACAAAEISSNHETLVYAVDLQGRRVYDLRFRDLKTGRDLPDRIDAVTANVVWAEDHRTVFYARQDPETLRSYQIWRYELGSNAPTLVFEEADVTYSVGVSDTRTRKHLFIATEKRDSSEWHYLDATNPTGEWTLVAPRESRHEYSVECGGDGFYILSDWRAPNFRVMKADFGARGKEEWTEVVAHDENVLLEGIDVYASFITLSAREDGLTQLRLLDRRSNATRTLKFPDPTYEVDARGLPEYGSPTLRFAYESLNRPPTIFEEVVATGERKVLKVREVPGYDAEAYESRRIWVTADDGARVPVSLVMRKGLALNGANPVLLYAYGSYGLNVPPSFRGSAVSLLDRGFVFAIAHIRGGSEMGRHWYESGRLAAKMNTFTDYIRAAETLIKDGYTSPAHLYAMGGSAGGLLMGGVLNLRPDLFNGAIAAVPFVDVLTTMLDESIPLTTGEYSEWGDPRIADQYAVMRTYSPYDNVERKAYPNLFVTTGYHDSQVQYWEPAKWLAKLREYKTDSKLLIMHTEMEAGHAGASGRFEALKTLAMEYGFLLMLEGKVE